MSSAPKVNMCLVMHACLLPFEFIYNSVCIVGSVNNMYIYFFGHHTDYMCIKCVHVAFTITNKHQESLKLSEFSERKFKFEL